jgi:hypothetical protein
MQNGNAQVLPLVRTRVREILTRTPAYRALPKPNQQSLARDMIKVASAIAGGSGGTDLPTTAVFTRQKSRSGSRTPARAMTTLSLSLINEVDFPNFVSGLIDGVFNSIVGASIKQMRAYAELVSNLAKTVDEFSQDNVTDGPARDGLAEPASADCADKSKAPDSKVRRLALDRQQALATQALMGINRIVVTKGTIKAGVTFDPK